MNDQPTEPTHHQTGNPRGGDGRYTASIETAERDAAAARLRSRGMSYRAIATELGYASHTSAIDAVKRALDAIRAEPAADVRTLELERLDRMYEAVLAVLEREHVTVSGGNIVKVVDADGEEKDLLDDGPVLQAVDRLLKIQARRAALLGLDAPVKADIGGTLTYEIIGVDMEAL